MTNDKKNKQQEQNTPAPSQDYAIWHLVAEGDWLAGQRFDIHSYAVLGRESNCDIMIPGTHLSRRHAELTVKGGILHIKDLDSSNGTYVNNKRVTEADLIPGDKVQFDVLTFSVQGPKPSADLDKNATKVRLIAPTKQQKRPAIAKPTEERVWKTKPTSIGNRSHTVHMPAAKKTASSFWSVLLALTGIATIAAVGYLITQL